MEINKEQPLTSVFTIPLLRFALFAVLILLIIKGLLQPAVFILFLLIIIELSRLWSIIGIRKVEVKRIIQPSRLFPKEETMLTIGIRNNKILPVGIHWNQPVIAEFSIEEPETAGAIANSTFLKGYSEYIGQYTLKALKRGSYKLDSIHLDSKDGLGLFRQSTTWNEQNDIIVYPRIIPLEEIPLNPADLMGDIDDCRPLLPDPLRIAGLREYTPDIPARYIHWKASAHKDDLLAKVMEPSADLRICIAVDVAAFKNSESEEEFELALSIAASLAFWADNKKIPLGLISNGLQKYLSCEISIPISSSYQQMSIVLESLARLENSTMGTLSDLLKTEGRHLPWGTTLVVVGDGTPMDVPGGVRNIVYYNVYEDSNVCHSKSIPDHQI